ncbi:hypothetical protein GOV13_00275 [Candidatus Pacearchaeota archaeon]|nr:hypothetical protein [Candidatus Pacearchaeota archaeon]
MKQALLDTNFILTCVRQKIDFFEDIKFMGMKIIIPIPVIEEIKRVASSKQKAHSKDAAELALRILEKNNFKKIKLDKKPVDNGIKDFANKNKNVIVATLDRELKNKIKGNKLVIRGKKTLEVM